METEKEVYQGVMNGECAVAVGYQSSFETFRRDKEVNGDCSLIRVGDILSLVESSIALKVDFTDRCTSLVQSVLNVHLKEMAEEGVIKDEFEKYRRQSQTISCFEKATDPRTIGRNLSIACYAYRLCYFTCHYHGCGPSFGVVVLSSTTAPNSATWPNQQCIVRFRGIPTWAATTGRWRQQLWQANTFRSNDNTSTNDVVRQVGARLYKVFHWYGT